MKIKIKENVQQAYISQRGLGYSQEWFDMLGKIAGQTLEVETEYLFMDQFNIAPIPGVSETVIGALGYMVESVIDDVRHSINKCLWCGNQQEKDLGNTCLNCGKETKSLLPQIMLDRKDVGIQ